MSTRIKRHYTRRYVQKLNEAHVKAQLSGTTATIIEGPGFLGINRYGTGLYALTGSEAGLNNVPYEFTVTILNQTSSINSLRVFHSASVQLQDSPEHKFYLASGTSGVFSTVAPPTALTVAFKISWES